jgi:hypothetical protein
MEAYWLHISGVVLTLNAKVKNVRKDFILCSISGWWRLARLGGRGEEEEEKREEDGTEILDCILTNSLVFGIK